MTLPVEVAKDAVELAKDAKEKVDIEIPSPETVTRLDWGAAPRRDGWEVLRLPVGNVLFTHTGGEECHTPEECAQLVRQLQTQHMDQGMTDIQYNFLVGGDCNVYEGRGWHFNATKDPIHQHLDGISIDIAFIGYFKGHQDPSDEMLSRAANFLEYLMTWGFVKEEFTLHSLKNSLSDDPNRFPPEEVTYGIIPDEEVQQETTS